MLSYRHDDDRMLGYFEFNLFLDIYDEDRSGCLRGSLGVLPVGLKCLWRVQSAAASRFLPHVSIMSQAMSARVGEDCIARILLAQPADASQYHLRQSPVLISCNLLLFYYIFNDFQGSSRGPLMLRWLSRIRGPRDLRDPT